jgi:hypothetical protein
MGTMMTVELPSEVGVYRGFYRSGKGKENGMTVTVQRADDGSWWPYPYSFSGWRESELRSFDFVPIPDLAVDIPEIRNPHMAERLEWFKEQLMSLTGVDPEEVDKLARQFVFDHEI